MNDVVSINDHSQLSGFILNPMLHEQQLFIASVVVFINTSANST